MVNIQIRGPLVHITVNQFTKNVITDMIDKEKNISEFIFKNKDLKNFDNIFNNTFPILSTTSEIHVSSFENDNYYDEGHTYFRADLQSIISTKNLLFDLSWFKEEVKNELFFWKKIFSILQPLLLE